MRTSDEPDPDALAAEILSYLTGHRNAADTRQGIAEWWIKRQRLEDAQAKIQAALDMLVARREIAAHRTASGAVLYRLRHDPTDPEQDT